MSPRKQQSAKTEDALLRSMLVLSRTVNHVLQERAIEVSRRPLSRSKTKVLGVLDRRKSQTPTQLARFLGLSKSAVTQLIDAMVDSNLVRRLSVEQDRREWEIKLTDEGKQVAKEIRGEQRHLVRNAVRHLDKSDAQKWTAYLHEISSSLAKADRSFDHFCSRCGGYANGTCVLEGGDSDCLFLAHHGDTPG